MLPNAVQRMNRHTRALAATLIAAVAQLARPDLKLTAAITDRQPQSLPPIATSRLPDNSPTVKPITNLHA
jgi:hypothetical protein